MLTNQQMRLLSEVASGSVLWDTIEGCHPSSNGGSVSIGTYLRRGQSGPLVSVSREDFSCLWTPGFIEAVEDAATIAATWLTHFRITQKGRDIVASYRRDSQWT